MVQITRTTKNAPSVVIIGAIITLGFIAGYFYYAQIGAEPEAKIPPAAAASLDTALSKFKDLKLNFGPFDDLKFKSLRVFGESPVQPGATGKQDLFSPIQ